MYVCFVKHPESDKPFLFDCTDIPSIQTCDEVVCKTSKGLQRGKVVSSPAQLDGMGAVAIVRELGAYWPLKKIVRKFGEVELLPEERREIAKRYIADHVDELPF